MKDSDDEYCKEIEAVMKDSDDADTKELEIEHSHGYFGNRWCKECEEYRYFLPKDPGPVPGMKLVECRVCGNALFVDE